MAKTKKRDVVKIAEEMGATLDVFDYGADACLPAGTVWKANAEHILCVGFFEGEHRHHAWEDLRERMEMGVEPCEYPGCETCAEGASS